MLNQGNINQSTWGEPLLHADAAAAPVMGTVPLHASVAAAPPTAVLGESAATQRPVQPKGAGGTQDI